MTTTGESSFHRLQALLAHDPGNANLILDTAQAAIDEGRLDEALDLLAYREIAQPVPPAARNLVGIVAMRREQWADAGAVFDTLIEEGHDATAVRFNAAWSHAMAGDRRRAIDLLDDETCAALPQAAALAINLLHDSGDLSTAATAARRLLALHPDHRGLNAAISTLAIDLDDLPLAERTAAQAGDHPEALTTLATLALGDDEPAAAAALFDRAIAADPKLPRAWVGRGLSRLLTDEKQEAAADIDRGAQMFGSHLGSWIAAGWAHLAAGDVQTARARFEHALQLDARFADSHGSLAVTLILLGRLDEARRGAETALRLDRTCFSGALAQMLLAAGDGDTPTAKRIFETALRQPVADGGRTLADALARLGVLRS